MEEHADDSADLSRRVADLEKIVAGLNGMVGDAMNTLQGFRAETADVREQLLGARRCTALDSLRGTANSARSEIHELFADQLSELGDDDQASADDLEGRVRDCMSFLASGFERATTEIRRSESPEDAVVGFKD